SCERALDGEDESRGAEDESASRAIRRRQAAAPSEDDGAVSAGENQSAGRLPADTRADSGVHRALLGAALRRRASSCAVDRLDPRSLGARSAVHPADRLRDHRLSSGEAVADADLRSGAGQGHADHAGRVLRHVPVLPVGPRALLARQQLHPDLPAVAHESRTRARGRAGDREAALTPLSPPPPTIAAIATPPGRGGIGIVRVSGADLARVTDGIVGKSLSPRVATSATFRDVSGAALDAGLALFFAAPSSYTGEYVLELHGHGSPAALRLLLARCIELGARIAEPGEFTKRAFLNGKLDLAQAEAVADLIDAATSTAARAAMKSLTGEFSRDVQSIVAAVTDLRMYTEATLDFPEEDIDFLRAHDK